MSQKANRCTNNQGTNNRELEGTVLERVDQGNQSFFLFLFFFSQGVDSLFNKINCDRSAVTDMLGGASGVTDANMMQVL